MSYAATYDSPLGRMIATSDDGQTLTSLRFAPEATQAKSDLAIFQTVFRSLDKYFNGVNPKKLPPLSIQATPFQLKVWREVRRIAPGKTLTYGELARKVRCGSAQAVGNAVGQNPILILIPCHRVVRSDGPGNYSAGAAIKSALLSLESRIMCAPRPPQNPNFTQL